jgi:hypothetical protein
MNNVSAARVLGVLCLYSSLNIGVKNKTNSQAATLEVSLATEVDSNTNGEGYISTNSEPILPPQNWNLKLNNNEKEQNCYGFGLRTFANFYNEAIDFPYATMNPGASTGEVSPRYSVTSFSKGVKSDFDALGITNYSISTINFKKLSTNKAFSEASKLFKAAEKVTLSLWIFVENKNYQANFNPKIEYFRDAPSLVIPFDYHVLVKTKKGNNYEHTFREAPTSRTQLLYHKSKQCFEIDINRTMPLNFDLDSLPISYLPTKGLLVTATPFQKT